MARRRKVNNGEKTGFGEVFMFAYLLYRWPLTSKTQTKYLFQNGIVYLDLIMNVLLHPQEKR